MSPSWRTSIHEVSGLSGRLYWKRTGWRCCRRARDLVGLAVALENSGLLPPGFAERSSPGALDLAVRRAGRGRISCALAQ